MLYRILDWNGQTLQVPSCSCRCGHPSTSRLDGCCIFLCFPTSAIVNQRTSLKRSLNKTTSTSKVGNMIVEAPWSGCYPRLRSLTLWSILCHLMLMLSLVSDVCNVSILATVFSLSSIKNKMREGIWLVAAAWRQQRDFLSQATLLNCQTQGYTVRSCKSHIFLSLMV